MKKLLTTFLIFGVFIASLFSGYSISLDTTITNISTGEYQFGFGMFPLGTSYTFTKSFQMVPGYEHQAYFEFASRFQFSNNTFENYELLTGKPIWSTRETDRLDEEMWYENTYFNPNSSLSIYLQQPLGTNPVTKSGELVTIRIGMDTTYSMALEKLGISRGDEEPTFIKKNEDNSISYIEPFGPGSSIMAFPWLQDSRKSLNNYIYLSTFWYFYENTAFGARDGVYIDLTLEYGPYWLGNNITQASPSCNYFRPSLYIDERLTLYAMQQENGRNWISLYLGHSNSLSYIIGDIIPENKIPTDRLRGSFNDTIWLRLTGPQFLAGDCYPYIDIALSNNFYFGTVVNEATQQIQAIEHKSNINIVFHLRFFGFIHFQYTFGYHMAGGIWPENPAWRQDAAVSFYVAI